MPLHEYHRSSHAYPGPTAALVFGVLLFVVGVAQFFMPQRTFWTMLGRRRSSLPAPTWSERRNRIAGVLCALAGVLVVVTNLASSSS